MKCDLLGLVAAVGLAASGSVSAQSFTESSTGLPITMPFGTSIADFNGDGKFDVLCFDGTPTNFLATLYQNTTGLGWARISPSWPGNTHGTTQTFWGDDNGDGLLDLIMTGDNDARQEVVKIYWQQSDHTFIEHVVNIQGEVTGWRDLDNDGRLEIITGGTVHWKEPDGTYTDAVVSSSVAIWDAADLDGDGHLDLLTISGTILRNDGGRRFVDTGVRLYNPIAVADMDGDGRLDVISNQADLIDNRQTFSDRLPIIFHNDGSFNFSSNAVPTGAYYYRAGAVGEMTGDAKTDFIVNATQFGIGFPPVVYVNTNGGFVAGKFTFPINANSAASIMLADFDGDGDLDLLTLDSERRRVFRNNSNLLRTVATPKNLRSVPDGNRVTLAWDAGDTTGTSFDIRVGTTPGGNDVVASESTAAGQRLVPRMGNAQTAGFWPISNLKPGVYYWTVQAVDWAYHGSPFAEEQTFTVVEPGTPPPAPTISAIEDVFTDEDTPVDVNFTLGPEVALASLKITVQSSVPALAPANKLQIDGEGTNRILHILPGTNQNGISTITLRVTDSSGQEAATSFALSVFPVNDPPFVSEIPNQVVYNNGGPLSIPYFVSDVEAPLRFPTVKVSAVSSDTNFLPNSSIEFKTDFRGETTNLVIIPPTNKVGSVAIKLIADDGEDQTISTFVLLVLPAQFQDVGAFPGPSVSSGMIWADFDNDGRLDVLIGLNGTPQMLLNKTNGFMAGFFNFPASSLGGTAVADLNRDNYLDVIMVSPDAVHIFLNQNGTNFISAAVGAIPKYQFPTLDLVDADNDGDLDLFVSGQSINGIFSRRLVINDAGTFRIASAPLANIGGAVTFADFDGDGWVDIAFAGTTASQIATNGMYRGIGGGQFQFVTGSSLFVPDSFSGSSYINSDGQPDLFGTVGRTLISYQNEAGHFAAETNAFDFFVGVRAAGDFDGDGLLDFIGVGSMPGSALTTVTALFQNRGENGFAAKLNPIPASLVPISFADINNDGTLDLVAAARPDWSNPRLFTNTSRALNPPPGPPRNLQANVSSNGMVLSWTAADDLNQTGGLTYNVRVGSQPGASDIVSASALASGKQLLVASGNAGGRLMMILTNLTRDTYYWSVQAIDNSFAGGPFAEEQIVHVTLPDNAAPKVVADPAIFVGGEDSAGQVSFTLSDDHTPVEDLKLRVFALDAELIPFTNISLSLTGATGGIKFHPTTNAFGETQIVIQGTDAGGLVGAAFVSVTITNINDPPKISAIGPQFSNGPGDPVMAAFSMSDVDDAPETLNVSVTSSDQATLPLENISLSGSGTNRSISLFTKSPAPADVLVAVTVTDPAGASATSSFTVSFTNRIFKIAQTNFPGVRSGEIAWGDFDDDGDLDFVLSGDGIINMALYVNAGDGSFTKAPILLPGPDMPIWADFDRDGDLDLLLNGGATLFGNLGNSTLQSMATGIPPGGGIFGDFDNDGDLDVVKSADTSSGIPRSYFMENTAAGFVQRNDIFALAQSFPIEFEDYDLDGWLDLRVARMGATWTNAIFLQRSNVFQLSKTPWPGELLLWGDFDNDGLPDAIVNNHPGYGDNGIELFRNEGAAFSQTGSIIVAPFFANHISSADYDNDGYLDILVNGSSFSGNGIYETKLFHNERNGTFREVQHPFPNYDSLRVSWADVDGDGDVDALVTAQPPSGYYVTWLFKNNQTTSNVPPSAPGGLRANYTADGLLIEWDESKDPNQSGGLTYNVAVGTAPGKWDVLSPMSSSRGYRQVVAKGNAGWRLSKLVRGLSAGQAYFYTVQAVDNSFAGSAFAPVQSIFATTLPQLNMPTLIDGMLQFTLLGPPGQFYVLEGSVDLRTWTPIISIDNAPIHVQAPLIGTDLRYFRVRVR